MIKKLFVEPVVEVQKFAQLDSILSPSSEPSEPTSMPEIVKEQFDTDINWNTEIDW